MEQVCGAKRRLFYVLSHFHTHIKGCFQLNREYTIPVFSLAFFVEYLNRIFGIVGELVGVERTDSFWLIENMADERFYVCYNSFWEHFFWNIHGIYGCHITPLWCNRFITCFISGKWEDKSFEKGFHLCRYVHQKNRRPEYPPEPLFQE